MLPCEAGSENFFIDPRGNVLPCNGMEHSCWFDTMGNLHDVDSFDEIWNSEQARKVRDKVAHCPKSCWMIGSVSPVMKKYITKVAPWVIKNKLRVMTGGKVDTSCIPFYHVGNNDLQGLREEK
jgi:radical SAM protein with 4Fe4S-binding SPASM domain